MSMKFPSTPRSGEPTPKAPPAEAADDDLTVESLFDARPADEAGKPGLLESALSGDKRSSAQAFLGARGRNASAEIIIPARTVGPGAPARARRGAGAGHARRP